nr:hypothetical protein [Tanacetum cinerariifolium]
MQFYIRTDFPTSALEIHSLVHIAYRWLKVVGEDVVSRQLSGLQATDAQINSLYEALAQLALATLGNRGMRVVLQHKWWKDRRATV